jgi:hypothetical protein
MYCEEAKVAVRSLWITCGLDTIETFRWVTHNLLHIYSFVAQSFIHKIIVTKGGKCSVGSWKTGNGSDSIQVLAQHSSKQVLNKQDENSVLTAIHSQKMQFLHICDKDLRGCWIQKL